jgi:filamentous hemagglutinin family protein
MIRPDPKPFSRRLLGSRRLRLIGAASATAVAWSLASAAAALPTGAVVVTSTDGIGTGASFTPGAGTLTIDQSAERVVIDWSTFNIDNGEAVTFNQPDANAIAFNRVDPSAFTTIDGSLTSNGGVWLFSPGGLLFGANASVNVGSFVGSTAQLADGDVAAAVDPNTSTINFSPLADRNGATLQIDDGAALTATNGFVVLQGETIVQNGDIVSNTDAVWIGVAEGGAVSFDGSGAAPALTDATVSAVPDRGRPALTQGATGSVDAATWAGVATPGSGESGWTTVINLGGSMNATGVRPGTNDGVVIITADDGVVDLSNTHVEVDTTTASITATADVTMAANAIELGDVEGASVTVDADNIVVEGYVHAFSADANLSAYESLIVESSGVVRGVDTHLYASGAASDLIVYGSVYGDNVLLNGADQVTVDGAVQGNDVDIQGRSVTIGYDGSVYGADTNLYGTESVTVAGHVIAYQDVTIGAAALIDVELGSVVSAGRDVTITTGAAGGDINIDGYVLGESVVAVGHDQVSVSGRIGADYDIYLYGQDVDISGVLAGREGSSQLIQVHAGDDITLETAGGIYASSVYVDGEGADSLVDIAGTISGDYVDIHSGRDVTVSGYIYAGSRYDGVSLSIEAEHDLTIEASGYLYAYYDLSLQTNDPAGQLLIDGGLYGWDVDILGAGDVTINGAAKAYGTMNIVSDGPDGTAADIVVDGIVAAQNGISIANHNDGVVSFGANASVSTYNFYFGECSECYGGDGGYGAQGKVAPPDALLGLDGDIYIYSAGQVVTAEGSVIDATSGVGADQGLVTIVAAGPDTPGAAAIDLSGDIVSYETDLSTTTGSIHQRAGTISATERFELDSADDFITDAGALITADDFASIDIYAVNDIYLGGAIDGYVVTINSSGYTQGGSLIEISGSIYATDTIIIYNDFGDIHLTGTAEIEAGDPVEYSYPSIFMGAEGSITADSGSYIHTAADFEGAYVRIEANDVAGAITLNGDITTGSLYVSANFGDTDVAIGAGTIEADATVSIYAARDIDVGADASIRAGYDIGLEAGDDITVAGDLTADNVSITASGEWIDANGGLVDITGYIYAYEGIRIVSAAGDIHVGSGAYINGGYREGSDSVYLGALDDLTVDDGATIVSRGYNVLLYTMSGAGELSVNGEVYGYDVEIYATGDLSIGSTAHIYAGDQLSLLSYSEAPLDADITIDGELLAHRGISIVNDNGDVLIGAGAYIATYTSEEACIECDFRTAPGGETGLLGADGDIYIYSASSVVTAAGSFIDATGGTGADKGLLTIVSNGTDGTYAAIDLSGDTVSYVTDLTANNGSIRQRAGNLFFSEQLAAHADQGITTDAGAVIDGSQSNAVAYLTANSGITLGGDLTAAIVEAYIVAPDGVDGADITVSGSVTGEQHIYLTNQVGDVILESGAVLEGNTDGTLNQIAPAIRIHAEAISADAGSLISTAQGGAASSELYLYATAASGTSIDLAGDIDVGIAQVRSLYDGSINVTGDITAADDIHIQAGGALTVADTATLAAGDLIHLRSDRDMLLGGDFNATYLIASIYGGEGGGVDESTIRLEGDIRADQTVRLFNDIGDVEIGTGAHIYGNLAGASYQEYQSYSVEITGENITTETDSLITVGADGGPRLGEVFLQATDYTYSTPGDPQLIDLSGDIDTETAVFIVDNGSMHVREGATTAIDSIDIYLDGYFDVDAPGSFDVSDGDFSVTSHAGMTMDGSIQAAGRVFLGDTGAPGISIDGDILADQDLTLHAYSTIQLGADATLVADADNVTGGQDFNGVMIRSDANVVTAAGSSIRVGPIGASTDDVTIYAGGLDGATLSAIDLSGDIDAQGLHLSAPNGSIRLRDGDIVLIEDLSIASVRGLIMDQPATITTPGDVYLGAVDTLTLSGLVDSGGTIDVHHAANDGGITLTLGRFYADDDITVYGLGTGDVVLGQTTMIADAAGVSPNSDIYITTQGDLIATGGDLIRVGQSTATGDVTLLAAGGDQANFAAIDLDADITARNLVIDAGASDGSVHIRGGAIVITNDLNVDANRDFLMDAGATIDSGGDVSLSATRTLTVDGDVTAADGIDLTLAGASSLDLTVGGDLSAGDSLFVTNNGDGDIVIRDGAELIADAMGASPGQQLTLSSGGRITTGEDSLLRVGDAAATGAATGNVRIDADGGDAGQYAAIDLSGDIQAAALTLQADNGSIHMRNGDIDVSADLAITSDRDIALDGKASITGGGDVSLTAARNLTVDGDIDAVGDIDLVVLDSPSSPIGFTADPGDLVVTGALTSDASVNIFNEGSGDIYFDPTATVLADSDASNSGDRIYAYAQGQIIAASGSTMHVGTDGAPTGDIELHAGGSDNASYSAIDLAGDIEAQTLLLDTQSGSINLADGTIHVTEDLTVHSNFAIVMDEPASIVGGADVSMTAAQSLQVNGSIVADGDISLLLQGANAQDLTIGGALSAGGDIDARNTGSGLLTLFGDGALAADGHVYLHSNGDMAIDGDIDAGTYVDAHTGSELEVGGTVLAQDDVTLRSSGDMNLPGNVQSLGGDVNARTYGALEQSGSVSAGGDAFLTSRLDMTIDGDVTAGDDVGLYLYGGEGGFRDIEVGGQVVAHDDVVIDNFTDDGDVLIGGEAVLIADADGDGGQDVALLIYAGDRVVADEGSSMHVGDSESRTGFIDITAAGQDSEAGAAIELSGDIDAASISITAYYGSVQVHSGRIAADNDIEFYAGDFFILDEDGSISGAENRTEAVQSPVGDIVYFSFETGPGVAIAAGDVDISGDITSGDMIAIGAYNVSGGEVTVGGSDPANLGTGFTLSNDEFQNLQAHTIVVLAGNGAGETQSGYDLHLADLTIDSDLVSEVFLGTQENAFVEGAVTPHGDGVDLHLGFAVAVPVDDEQGLGAGEMLVGFVPGNIYISGSLGSVDHPFGSVTLIAEGDILMGSHAFMSAASEDPEFDALEQSDEFDSPGEDHVFIASDILQMASTGRILQQNTDTDHGFAGLVIGAPQQGVELIFVPGDLEGESFGQGTPLDFSAGPGRIELFGTVNTQSGPVSDIHAAGVPNLLDPEILLGEYYINSCKFGTAECALQSDDVPPFQPPFPPVEVPTDPGDVLTFFSGFPFAEPDDEDDEDQIQGEPVTGSGNEDLWTIKPTGVRP